jgi:hypothetical protein
LDRRRKFKTGREHLAGAGTQTAGLAFGGTPDSTATEKYDGTSWTTTGSLNTGREIFSRCWNSNCRFSFWWL